MRMRGVEDEQDTYEVEVECRNCDYTRVLKLPRNQLLIRMACPMCNRSALTKKGRLNTIHHQKDL